MKLMTFARRNTKEILRDPLNLAFGIGFPIVLLLLLSLIQANIPDNGMDLFKIEKLIPGIAVFGLSFISLFSSVLISKDRTSSFMLRLFTSPMKASDFLLGYILPLIPLSLAQSVVCYAFALILGLNFTVNIFLAIILVILPTSLLFIGIGLLCGSLLTDKQVGGVCGALLTNLSAWLSGTWFDVSLVGGAFEKIAYALPFVHAVDAGRLILAGDIAASLPHLLVILGYAVVILVVAIIVFTRKMTSD